VDDATSTISDIIGAGIIPGALEMLDTLILQAVEAAFHFGFPLDAGAVLIMEVDGLEAGLDADAERIVEIALKNKAREVRRAQSDAERLLRQRAVRRDGAVVESGKELRLERGEGFVLSVGPARHVRVRASLDKGAKST